MAGHTPGPWEASGLSVMARPEGVVARCPTPQNGGTFACNDNARLIAAAPDLLAACEAVDNHLHTTFPPYPPGESPYDQVRAALRKARGQTDDANPTNSK